MLLLAATIKFGRARADERRPLQSGGAAILVDTGLDRKNFRPPKGDGSRGDPHSCCRWTVPGWIIPPRRVSQFHRGASCSDCWPGMCNAVRDFWAAPSAH